jgi:long-chain acyl-CoA synthetase
MNTHRKRHVHRAGHRDRDARRGATAPSSGIAPLFHITGLIGHIAVSMLVPAPLVLAYRFEPQVVLDALLEHRPAFTIGAITAFSALLNAPGFTEDHFSSFTSVYSGGAAISPTAEQAFRKATGKQVHNAYGLTETTSPMTLTPFGSPSPVDPTSGGTVGRLSGAEHDRAHPGRRGPGSAARRDRRDRRRRAAGRGRLLGEAGRDGGEPARGALKSGDVGFMNPEGWVFIVDRKKDMINASATRCGRARSRTSWPSTPPYASRRWSACPTRSAARP